ncbi:uncharacterized protein [Miscanthus floridulus]|uniref:uncharacterized protein n=1 Tax=Miscanthus floridulus TaxID=154761 RepID=UPI00345AD591
MGTPWSSLCPSKVPFYGIIPRKETAPLRRIQLNVTFGQPDNFQKEPLTFEVVDFPSIYHALLARPCFAKLTAISNYTYLKLKMPGPNGVIIIEGSFEQAYYCEQDCIAQVATLSAPYGPTDSDQDTGRALVKGQRSQGDGDAQPTEH